MGRKLDHREKCQKGETKTQNASFCKRSPTLIKKAKELQTLCDVFVCVVCFGPQGNVSVWPENHERVKKIIMSYQALDDDLKRESNYLDLLQAKKKKLANKVIKQKIDRLISSLGNKLDGLSGSCLMNFVNELEGKVENFKKRIDFLIREEKRKGKAIQVANQEINLSSSPFESVDVWLANIDKWLMSNSSENPLLDFQVESDVLLNNDFPVNAIPKMENLSMVMEENNSNYLIPTDNQSSYLHEALPISVWSSGSEFW